MKRVNGGFTLIELVIGMVLLSIALTGMLGLLLSQTQRGLDPVQEVRAAQLAQRLASEILQKSFDERSDHNGSHYRCGESIAGYTILPCSSSYGADGEPAPYSFNDVDDFDTGGSWIDANLFTQTAAGVSSGEYRNYQLKIAVSAASFANGTIQGCTTPCSVGKRVVMQVKLPDQRVVDFSFYRGNY